MNNNHDGHRRIWEIVGLLSFAGAVAYGQPSQLPLQHFWRTDGPVYTIAASGNTAFIGGVFQYVGPWTGGAGILSATTGIAEADFPRINGTISAAIPDGQGGWYLGGTFTSVGGTVRSNLVHVYGNNTVDPGWNPGANGSVLAMVVQSNTLYLGGTFTRLAGQTRNRLAALDLPSGGVLSFNPNVNSGVNALVFGDGMLIAGGAFATIGGQQRGRLASFDAATGQLTSWNPTASAVVNALAISGSTVYAGGAFTTAGTKPRNRIAAFSTTSDVALDWNPNASGAVEALAVAGNTVYAAGAFTSIGSATRNRIAALDADTFVATAWDPNANGTVNTLAVSSNTVFIGGTFTSVGGQSRNTMASIDSMTGAVNPWNPLVSGFQDASSQTGLLAVQGDEVLLGSTFASLGGVLRTNLAAIDLETGKALDWAPNANGLVRALTLVGNTLYAGGTFTNVGGLVRRRLAALDVATGTPTSWNPNVLGRPSVGVSNIVASGDRLFVGGNFTNILGSSRPSIAAFDLNTGDLLPSWNPGAQPSGANASASVNALVVVDDLLYAGGDFVTFGGQSRSRLAAVNAHTTTAILSDWNPGAQSTVLTLLPSGNTLYVGGLFTTLGGQTRGRIGAVDAQTGTTTAWNPDAGSTTGIQVRTLALAGGSVYAGGAFTRIGGEFRNRLAGIRTSNGLAHSWDPDLNAAVNAICTTPSLVLAGGDFTTIGAITHAYFAVFSSAPAFLPETVLLANGVFSATLRTGEGARMVIQTSSDLGNWTTVSTNSVGAAVPFTDMPPAGTINRFYRAFNEQQ